MSHAAAMRWISHLRHRSRGLAYATTDATSARGAARGTPGLERHVQEGLLWCLLLLLSGCGSKAQLETAYGHRRGSDALSVNGTRVLSGMFEEAGIHAVTITYLSSRLDKYDVLVWAPDDFAPPTSDVQEFLDGWLTSQSNRTLVYVGRDYDAACDYWRQMARQAPADQRLAALRHLAQATSKHQNARIEMPRDKCCEWFVARRDYPGRRVRQLDGPWRHGMDADASRIWSQGRLEIPADQELDALWGGAAPPRHLQPRYQPLLTSGAEDLVFVVSKPVWGSSKIVVVANGSFLLNLPLVNHQHRVLAGKLIGSCGTADHAAFLESDASGPPLLHAGDKAIDEESLRRRVLLAAHWLVLGMLFCFSVFPIFGRPKSRETEAGVEFGEHIDALAALLERTGNVSYARRQVDQYRQAMGGREDSRQTDPENVPRASRDQDVAGGDTDRHRNGHASAGDGALGSQT